MPYAGKDISEVMADPGEHEHSKSAYMMMDEVGFSHSLAGRQAYASSRVATGRSALSRPSFGPARPTRPHRTIH